ncbi:FAN-like protein [Mya arenaria]|uniref:FAN-like protein n=1 Tax=Mya arenaria TaxID=6604 RepID=A0ABY7EYG3_MYAAR|nr:FAN-like protein [Mya arenaria]
MKKDNVISPYGFQKGEQSHVFCLNYVTVEDCLPLLCQLHRASTLPPADQNSMGISLMSTSVLSCKSPAERDNLHDKIMAQKDVSVESSEQQDMTLKWQNGVISNYDYLIAADRSFYDLTQYPVMPWVIQDFTSTRLDLENPETFRDLSKPIGALSEERLARMKERYDDMPEPKFLYGAHYSTPGYVLFYLSRLAPEYVLCLQNGKFDQPDRMFNSLWELWQNCLHGAADFKELIPEFYESNGNFMVNTGVCNFGVRQDGRPVGNVELPPWAEDSNAFIRKMREALECDYVSKQIHNWIDLIFGYKQRGEEAEKADNVFYYMTYEGAVDLDSITDPNERACIEIQIMEFGQVPKQLFTTPHPVRHGARIEHPISGSHSVAAANGTVKDQSCLVEKDCDKENMSETNKVLPRKVDFSSLNEVLRFSLHKQAITDVKLCLKRKMAFSVSQGPVLLQLDHDYSISDVAVDDSCATMVSATKEGQIYVWDLLTYSLNNMFHAFIRSLAVCYQHVVVGLDGGQIQVWDMERAILLNTCQAHTVIVLFLKTLFWLTS